MYALKGTGSWEEYFLKVCKIKSIYFVSFLIKRLYQNPLQNSASACLFLLWRFFACRKNQRRFTVHVKGGFQDYFQNHKRLYSRTIFRDIGGFLNDVTNSLKSVTWPILTINKWFHRSTMKLSFGFSLQKDSQNCENLQRSFKNYCLDFRTFKNIVISFHFPFKTVKRKYQASPLPRDI